MVKMSEFLKNEEIRQGLQEELTAYKDELKKFVEENIEFFVEETLEDTQKNIRMFFETATEAILSSLAVAKYDEEMKAIKEEAEEIAKYL